MFPKRMILIQYNTLLHNNGVFTGVFTCRCAACEDAGRAAYSQLRLHITGEYNRQQAGISSQTTDYVARHPVYAQRVHSYSRTRSQKLEISNMQRVKCSMYMRQHLAIYTSVASKNAGAKSSVQPITCTHNWRVQSPAS